MAVVENGPVRPHAQAFADAIDEKFGAVAKTYGGHSPTKDRALDIWDTGADLEAVVAFALENWTRYGVMYVIYRQQIYNPEIAPRWRTMEDRGTPTNNHFDHVHVSFQPTGDTAPGHPITEENPFMALNAQQQADLYETTMASNAAVGRLEVAIRDQVSGLQVAVGELQRKLNELLAAKK